MINKRNIKMCIIILQIVKVLSTNDTNCSVVVEAKHNSKEGRVLLQMQVELLIVQPQSSSSVYCFTLFV